jgi:hypothetical protein
MKIFTAYSQKQTAIEAVAELKEIFNKENTNNNKISYITFFVSAFYNPEEFITEFSSQFPNIPHSGSSAGGEMCNDKILHNSIVAMAFTDQVISNIDIQVIENVKNNFDVKPVMVAFEKHFNINMSKISPEEYFGLLYVDFSSRIEEKLLDDISDRTFIIFGGGSSSDNLTFDKTCVYANGRVYKDAAVLTLIKPKVSFSIEKIQSAEKTDLSWIATSVDESNRIIKTLNSVPARDIYCQAVGMSIAEASQNFMANPLALDIDGKLFLRGIFQFTEDGGIECFCSVKENACVSLARQYDVVNKTRTSLNLIEQNRNISGMVVFDCIHRYLAFIEQELEYAKLFSDAPTIGFHTYGEHYIGRVNQTAIILVIE